MAKIFSTCFNFHLKLSTSYNWIELKIPYSKNKRAENTSNFSNFINLKILYGKMKQKHENHQSNERVITLFALKKKLTTHQLNWSQRRLKCIRTSMKSKFDPHITSLVIFSESICNCYLCINWRKKFRRTSRKHLKYRAQVRSFLAIQISVP